MLKRTWSVMHLVLLPAAFGRLCVETVGGWLDAAGASTAAFGRLCVETLSLVDSTSRF